MGSKQSRYEGGKLRFHRVHGDNITLSEGSKMAHRSEGFCKAIVFSDRPIMISEPVYVKIVEILPNWTGALRIGFTMNDPLSLKSKLPEYACPDLTSMPGNWVKAVGEKRAVKDAILYFYVDQNGDVHYGSDAEEYGIFFGGVNTSGKLWAVLDIYGNTLAVEFLDPSFLNQDSENDLQSNSTSQTKEKQNIISNTKSLSFHSVHGKNVILKKHRSVVSRKSGLHSLAYAFTEQPIKIGQTIIMKVLKTDPYFEGPFIYGITSCDPKNIVSYELPDDVDDLLDRREYWVVKQKSYPYEIGNTIKFVMTNQGQVEITINKQSEPFFYVDHTQPLWFFINLSNSISELQLEGILCNSESIEDLNEAVCNMEIRKSSDKEVIPGPSGQQTNTECIICYEELVDCVLYRCGHMCMCYKCALNIFKSNSSAQCPICRNIITDVIKIYK